MSRAGSVLAIVLLLATVLSQAGTVSAQPSMVRIGLEFGLRPSTNEVVLAFRVDDPGSLISLTVDTSALANPPKPGLVRTSEAWSRDGTRFTAEFPGPDAELVFTVDSRVSAQTLEGEGFTSYVGAEFAVLRMGDLVPVLSFSYPEDRPPEFTFHMVVDAPPSWSVAGPWDQVGPGEFRSDSLPQGFLAAGPLAVVDHAADATTVTAVRVAGTREPDELVNIVGAGRSFLTALYGSTPDELHLVVAPDPMYRGGLASPFGMFLHDEVDPAVAAHELIHVHQRFQASRDPADATVWFLEGAAVLHGALVEVVAGLKTPEQAQQALEAAHGRATASPAPPAGAVYGSATERAAYDQGALVVAALDEEVREATGGSASLADVLVALNDAKEGERLSNDDIARAVANVTGRRPDAFFDAHVWGDRVPDVVDVRPNGLVLRLAGTRPAPAVQGPVAVVLEASNLGVAEGAIDHAVRLDGVPAGQVQIAIPVGATRTIDIQLGTLDAGSHALTVGPWRFTIDVLRPPKPAFDARAFPSEPAAGDVLAVAVQVRNDGEAPWNGSMRMRVNGVQVAMANITVDGGRSGVANLAAVLQQEGPARIDVVGPAGETVWSSSYSVAGPRDAPLPGAAALVALLIGCAALGRARRRN